MKKIIAFVLALAMTLSLVACGASRSPKNVVEKFFHSIQKLDINGIEDCIHDGDHDMEELESDAEDLDDYLSKDLVKCLKDYTSKIKYSVVDVSEEEDEATATVSFTYPDAGPAIAEAVGQIAKQSISQMFSGDDIDEDELAKQFSTIMKDKLKNADMEMKTAEVDVYCIKTDDGWKVANLSDDLQELMSNIMSFNIYDALNDLNW